MFYYEEGFKSKIFSEAELKILKREFNPDTKTGVTNKWHELLSEQQAETFAHFMYIKYKESFSGAAELVEKYLYKFINLE